MTYEIIKQDPAVRVYIEKANESLMALGYTEHSFAHVARVAEDAGRLLEELGFDGRTVELTKIAGFLHDIGNLVNRVDHSQSGALMAFRILDRMGFPPEEIAMVVTAIGNHDEGTGIPVSPLAAALILADKSDVRRTRVRNPDPARFDIHDRVNFSVSRSEMRVDREKKQLELSLTIDTAVSSVMEYFEIFLGRMVLCRTAAEALGLDFHLVINGQKLV